MFAPDPFVTTVALGPLAIYLLVIGGLRLSGHPLVTSGARDLAALSLGLSGMVVMGPMQLFFPTEALARWGAPALALLIGLYALCVLLVVMSLRPRMIIYGIGAAKSQVLFLNAARTVDAEARAEDEFVTLPQWKTRFRVDDHPGIQSSQVVLTSRYIEPRVWWSLLERMKEQVRTVGPSPGLGGIGLVATGTLLAALVVWRIVDEPQAMEAGLRAWLRL